ncbi:hypothetical protein E4T44_00483 [Aureobasidium sp. EXF-8845]|nr:hypothetical protein E4T44_00483 [Aureobasidium sp. EXF-8845]KAI4857948.1 hypothetical protein E4T45_00543 [Aureobasidium sp. EXF-8846]
MSLPLAWQSARCGLISVDTCTSLLHFLALAPSESATPIEDRLIQRCTTRDLTIVRRTVIDPVHFCKWWQEEYRSFTSYCLLHCFLTHDHSTRTRTPFLEFTVSEVNNLCTCIAPRSSARPTKHKRTPSIDSSPLAKRSTTSDACRKEMSLQFTEPWHFCVFYNAYPRTSSPFRKYATQDLIKLYRCVGGKMNSLTTKKTLTSTRKQSASATKGLTTTSKTPTSTKKASTIVIKPPTSFQKSTSSTSRISTSTKKISSATIPRSTSITTYTTSTKRTLSTSSKKSSTSVSKATPSSSRTASTSTKKNPSSTTIGSTSGVKSSSSSISRASSSSTKTLSTSTSEQPSSTSSSILASHHSRAHLVKTVPHSHMF